MSALSLTFTSLIDFRPSRTACLPMCSTSGPRAAAPLLVEDRLPHLLGGGLVVLLAEILAPDDGEQLAGLVVARPADPVAGPQRAAHAPLLAVDAGPTLVGEIVEHDEHGVALRLRRNADERERDRLVAARCRGPGSIVWMHAQMAAERHYTTSGPRSDRTMRRRGT